jgi:hypothetical protein
LSTCLAEKNGPGALLLSAKTNRSGVLDSRVRSLLAALSGLLFFRQFIQICERTIKQVGGSVSHFEENGLRALGAFGEDLPFDGDDLMRQPVLVVRGPIDTRLRNTLTAPVLVY